MTKNYSYTHSISWIFMYIFLVITTTHHRKQTLGTYNVQLLM